MVPGDFSNRNLCLVFFQKRLEEEKTAVLHTAAPGQILYGIGGETAVIRKTAYH